MKKRINKYAVVSSLLFIAVSFTAPSYADDADKVRADFKAKLAEMAGPLGPFARAEDFPKSYFLIPQNLPFMVGLTMHHPMSQSLDLSDKQKGDIKKIAEATVPVVTKAGKEIKVLEVALAKKFVDGATPSEMDGMVDEISVLRTELTKKHLRCIDQVRTILTAEQFDAVQGYANAKAM